MMVRRLGTVLAAALAIVALAACGDDEKEVGGLTPGATVPLQIQEQPEVVQELDEALQVAFEGVIEVAAADTKFSPNKLTLAAGDSVLIRVTNSDTTLHNLRIAGLDGEYDSEDDAVALPESIASGESGELNFAPLAAGAYTFRCDFHPGSMGGQVVVR